MTKTHLPRSLASHSVVFRAIGRLSCHEELTGCPESWIAFARDPKVSCRLQPTRRREHV